MPFSVYPCTPHRINPACFHPAGCAPGFAGCCHQYDGDGIAVDGGFGPAMVRAVLVDEADLAPLPVLLDTLVVRASMKC